MLKLNIKVPARSISKEEERGIITKYLETRDVSLRNKIVDQYYRLAISMVQRHGRFMSEHSEDLFQQTIFGLIEAVEKYNPESGTLQGWMITWMRAHIYKYIMATSSAVKGPNNPHFRKLFYRHKLPDFDNKTAEELGVTEQNLIDFKDFIYHKNPLLLDKEREDGKNPHELVAAQNESQENLLHIKMKYESIMSRVNNLSDTDRFIFNARFVEERTACNISKDLNMNWRKFIGIETEMKKNLTKGFDVSSQPKKDKIDFTSEGFKDKVEMLSEQEKIIFAQFFVENITYKDIGSNLSLSQNQVRWIVERIKKQLTAVGSTTQDGRRRWFKKQKPQQSN